MQNTVSRVSAVVVSLLGCYSSQAINLYATSYEGQGIYKCDTVLNTNTLVHATGPMSPDSLLFAPNGDIIYSSLSGGTVQRFDPVGNTDTTIGSGFTNPNDMALEPSGTSVLVADNGSPALRRVSLTGGPTTLVVNGTYNGGLIYVGSQLFGVANSTQINRIDPLTGATLASSVNNPAADLDGLTYDSFSGNLWATDMTNGLLVEFSPATLTYVTHTIPTIFGFSILPDGIASDGAGNIYFASRKNFSIYSYDIGTGISTPLNNVFGLDDIAPLTGPGSPSVPEPSAIAAIVLTTMMMRRRMVR